MLDRHHKCKCQYRKTIKKKHRIYNHIMGENNLDSDTRTLNFHKMELDKDEIRLKKMSETCHNNEQNLRKEDNIYDKVQSNPNIDTGNIAKSFGMKQFEIEDKSKFTYSPGFCLEFIDGKSVREISNAARKYYKGEKIKSEKPGEHYKNVKLSHSEFSSINQFLLKGTLEGIKQLGECGLIHADIKEENVMFSYEDGRVILIDLGVAAPIENPNFKAVTQDYCAPEVLSHWKKLNLKTLDKEGKLQAGTQTDVFSVGQMAREMTNGTVDYLGNEIASNDGDGYLTMDNHGHDIINEHKNIIRNILTGKTPEPTAVLPPPLPEIPENEKYLNNFGPIKKMGHKELLDELYALKGRERSNELETLSKEEHMRKVREELESKGLKYSNLKVPAQETRAESKYNNEEKSTKDRAEDKKYSPYETDYAEFVNGATRFDGRKRLKPEDALQTNYLQDSILSDAKVIQLIKDMMKGEGCFAADTAKATS